MLVILGILAAVALGGMFFMFFSPKSSEVQKKAALGALIVCGLVLSICAFIVIRNLGNEADPYALPPETLEVHTGGGNLLELLIFLFVLLGIFGFIIYMGIRQKKKQELKKAHNADKVPEFSAKDF